MNQIAIIGYDLEVLELMESKGEYKIIGYVDICDKLKNDIKYLGSDDIFYKKYPDKKVVLSMDIPSSRRKMFYFYEKQILHFVTHKTAIVSKRSFIDIGALIQANVLISSYVNIGKGCLINHNASVHHESKIGDFTVVAPSATILGKVTVGSGSYIGAGSIIKERVSIGSNSIIGAGAVVINDVPDNVVIVGNPANKIISNKHEKRNSH